MAITSKEPPLTGALYPFASAPDIIRAQQKDAYFQGVLTNQLSDLHRRLRGARSAHAWATESKTAADLLYLSLTTLLGNRTLGEEYCDLVQVETSSTRKTTVVSATGEKQERQAITSTATPQLPSLQSRASYIAASVLAPYLASRLLPSFRAALRARLHDRLAALKRQGHTESFEYRARRYILAHLATLTSGAHAHALTLAVFYFTGAYYSLAKRLVGLRYVFTRPLPEGPAGSGDGRAGYEVLGVLLVVQMAVRAYLHVQSQMSAPLSESEAGIEAAIRERAFGGPGVNVSLDENSYTSNNELLMGTEAPGGGSGQRSLTEIGATMHTPVVGGGRPRYFLGSSSKDGEAVMGWIKGDQQRKCTLCLEELKDPAATQCGHVFCWACISDWVREKPECPLCRREAMVQHILPLRMPGSV